MKYFEGYLQFTIPEPKAYTLTFKAKNIKLPRNFFQVSCLHASMPHRFPASPLPRRQLNN